MNDHQSKACFLDPGILKAVPQFEFILRARANRKEIRPWLKDLLVYDNLFCTTDGRRLHYCRDKSLLPGVLTEPGAYTVQGSKTAGYHIAVDCDSVEHLPEVNAIIDEKMSEPVGFAHNLNIKKKALPLEASRLLARCASLAPFTGLQYPYICDLYGYTWEARRDKAAAGGPWHFTTAGDLGAVITLFKAGIEE